jgi:uncharacterized protein DUF4031
LAKDLESVSWSNCKQLAKRSFADVEQLWKTRGMTVYVDDAVTWWRGQRWAHLMADTLDELHAMAARLGMPRRAFQDKTSGAHYDVTVELREQALRLGAMAISRHTDRELVRAVIRNAKAQATQP